MANILLATSSKAALKHFEKALSPDGHTITHCADGMAVLSALLSGLPDAVIADSGLPGMDPFELVQALQNAAKGEPLPPLIIRPQEGNGGAAGEEYIWLDGSEASLRSLVRARLAAGSEKARGRVLVVDDDSSLRTSLRVRLEKEGHEVVTCSDGSEALEALDDSIDLVLTDVDMPVLDGMGLLQRIRSKSDYDALPVVVMTARDTGPDQAAQGLDLGANDYVRKPFDWNELTSRVQAQLRVRENTRLSAEKQRDLAIIELAGAAAHEINNPLAVIMARLELLRGQDSLGSPLREELAQLDRLVQRVAKVVKKMSEVRTYQVQNYCAGVNILDLDASSGSSEP